MGPQAQNAAVGNLYPPVGGGKGVFEFGSYRCCFSGRCAFECFDGLCWDENNPATAAGGLLDLVGLKEGGGSGEFNVVVVNEVFAAATAAAGAGGSGDFNFDAEVLP